MLVLPIVPLHEVDAKFVTLKIYMKAARCSFSFMQPTLLLPPCSRSSRLREDVLTIRQIGELLRPCDA